MGWLSHSLRGAYRNEPTSVARPPRDLRRRGVQSRSGTHARCTGDRLHDATRQSRPDRHLLRLKRTTRTRPSSRAARVLLGGIPEHSPSPLALSPSRSYSVAAERGRRHDAVHDGRPRAARRTTTTAGDTPRSVPGASCLRCSPHYPRSTLADCATYVTCFSRRWRLRTAGARWAGRPGSSPRWGWPASRPVQVLCPGRCRGIAACPGR